MERVDRLCRKYDAKYRVYYLAEAETIGILSKQKVAEVMRVSVLEYPGEASTQKPFMRL